MDFEKSKWFPYLFPYIFIIISAILIFNPYEVLIMALITSAIVIVLFYFFTLISSFILTK